MRQAPLKPDGMTPGPEQTSGTAWPPMTVPPRTGFPTTRPLGERAIPSGGQPRVLLAQEASRVIGATQERERQRRRVIAIIALAHCLLALALIPGFVSPAPDWAVLGPLGGVAVVSLLTILLSNSGRKSNLPGSLLIFGTTLAAIAAMGLLTYYDASPVAVAQVAVLLVAPLIEAGLFLSPELVFAFGLVVIGISGGLIVTATLHAPAQQSSLAYLGLVSGPVLMALATVASWFVSQFVYDGNVALQRAMNLGFVEAQLESTQQQATQSKARIAASVAQLQQAISALMTGGQAHVAIIEGELEGLMRSFNLMVQQVGKRNQTPQHDLQLNTLAQRMMKIIAEMTEGVDGDSPQAPELTHTAMDSVIIALTQLQGQYRQRLGLVQEVAQDIAGAVRYGHDGLKGTAQEVDQAVALIGDLVNAAHMLKGRVQTLHGETTASWRTLADILPDEVVTEIDRRFPGAATLTGADATGDYEGLNVDINGTGHTGEVAHLPVSTGGATADQSRTAASEKKARGNSRKANAEQEAEAPAELVAIYEALTQVRAELAHDYEALSSLASNLGKVSRTLHSGDKGIAYGLTALDSALQASGQLQQIVGLHGAQFTPAQSGITSAPIPQAPAPASRVPDERAGSSSPMNLQPRPDGVPGTGELSAADLIAPDIIPHGFLGGPAEG